MNIFITGISRGLGLELTKHFLEQGHTVMGISRTKTDTLEALLADHPDRLRWCHCDLLETDRIEDCLRTQFALSETRIDAFIDNAALPFKNLIQRIKANEVAEIVAVNTVAPMIVTKVMLDNFLRFKTKGCIIHMSSICAHKAFNGLAVMGATKAALEAFSRDTAFEYGRFGIRSNTIVAGLLDLGMKSEVTEKHADGLKSLLALRRFVDTPSIIHMMDYLLSDQASCITGQSIHIDAGIV